MKYILLTVICFSIISCSPQHYEDPIPLNNVLTKVTCATYDIDIPYSFQSINNKAFWATCKCFEDRITACEVPEECLSAMTTKALVETCIDYPLLYCFSAYTNELQAVKTITDFSNAYQELLSRSDAADAIIDFYSNASVRISVDSLSIGRIGNRLTLTQMHFLELLIGSGIIPEIYDESHISQLKAAVSINLEYMYKRPNIFSIHSLKTAILINKITERGEAIPFEEASKMLRDIEYGSESLTKSAGNLIRSVSLRTPFNKTITAFQLEDFTPYESLVEDFNYSNNHPDAILLNCSTYSYNCHSYAWNMNIGGPAYWIDYIYSGQDQIAKYYTNDAYSSASSSSADVILYNFQSNNDHSAIPSTHNGMFISKWDHGPLMEHYPSDVPYPGVSSYSYYKLRSEDNYPNLISGDDLVVVGSTHQYACSIPAWYNYNYLWEVGNDHEGENNDFSVTQVGDYINVTFNRAGEFYVTLKYCVGGYCIASRTLPIVAY